MLQIALSPLCECNWIRAASEQRVRVLRRDDGDLNIHVSPEHTHVLSSVLKLMNVTEEVGSSLMRQRSTAADSSAHWIETVKPPLTCVCVCVCVVFDWCVFLKADADHYVFEFKLSSRFHDGFFPKLPEFSTRFYCWQGDDVSELSFLTSMTNTSAMVQFNWMEICGLRDLQVT